MADDKRWLPESGNGTQTTENIGGHTPQVRVVLDNGEEVDVLRSIDTTLKSIYKSGIGMSQSVFRNSIPGKQYDTGYSNDSRWRTTRRQKSDNARGRYKSDGTEFKGILDEFEDGLREALLDSLGTSNFKDNISKHLRMFEKEFGVNLRDVPKALGKDLGAQAINAMKRTNLGKSLSDKVSGMKDSATTYAKTRMLSAFGKGVAEHDYAQGDDKYTFGTKLRKMSQGQITPDSTELATSDISQHVELPQSDSAAILLDQQTLIQSIAANVEIIASLASANMKTVSTNGQFKYADEFRDVPEVSRLSNLKTQSQTTLQDKGTEIISKAVGDSKGLDATVAGVKEVGKSLIDDAGAAVANFAGKLGLTCPQLALLAAGAAIVAYGLIKSLGPAIEGTKQLFEEMKKSGNRYQESRKKNLEAEKARIEADTKLMVQKPFEILTEAAEAWYRTWDENLRTISATQGYNKDDVYALMASYADRLRNEGLTDVVSSADISTNLGKVLQSGLSGQVAEEFAYIATILESAVPTQDWWSYGETYASIAANAIANGQSQSAAIKYANEQMELFASNVLYAGRQLSGGFSSGLKDAQSLFEASNKIATASKQGQVSAISGVLTSVSAVVGAIAPDLSSGLVDAVVNAAIGGNSSEIVALRSLAGVNASNTEFLKLLAQNPKGIFEELFRNLANMQNMSNDNYMEVAEGLADVFGISMDAFARVDFNYLADAISQMNVNNASLQENLDLLSSGETTSNKELLRYQQINKYMLDEGLHYVMDNEAARQIQQHMWDEQLAREIMEAEYAVNLQGSALTFIEGISETVQRILDFLNPLSFLKKLNNLVVTAKQADAQRDDVRQLLELGKIGAGNAKALYNLTTTGQDLGLTKSLNALMGGYSKYEALDTALDLYNTTRNVAGIQDMHAAGKSFLKALTQSTLLAPTSSTFWTGGKQSKYDWDTVGKSTNNFLTSTSFASNKLTVAAQALSTSAASQVKSNARMQEFVDSMKNFAGVDGKTYDDWLKTASSYGIKDVGAALDDYGLTEQQLKNQFQAAETQKGTEAQHKRNLSEEKFWEQGQLFWNETHPQWGQQVLDKQEVQIAHQVSMLGKLDSIFNLQDAFFKKFFIKWSAEFETHDNYKPNIDLSEVNRIQREEKNETGDAVLALAQALTANSTELKDPAVQTNVLLSKILLVAEAIMQQNNQGGGSSLAATLQGLSLGLTTTEA